MTRKDYVLLAQAFAAARADVAGESAEAIGLHKALMQVCDALQQENGAFDRDKFVAAARPVKG